MFPCVGRQSLSHLRTLHSGEAPGSPARERRGGAHRSACPGSGVLGRLAGERVPCGQEMVLTCALLAAVPVAISELSKALVGGLEWVSRESCSECDLNSRWIKLLLAETSGSGAHLGSGAHSTVSSRPAPFTALFGVPECQKGLHWWFSG